MTNSSYTVFDGLKTVSAVS